MPSPMSFLRAQPDVRDQSYAIAARGAISGTCTSQRAKAASPGQPEARLLLVQGDRRADSAAAVAYVRTRHDRVRRGRPRCNSALNFGTWKRFQKSLPAVRFRPTEQCSTHAGEEPEAFPSVGEQRSRPPLLLVVPSESTADRRPRDCFCLNSTVRSTATAAAAFRPYRQRGGRRRGIRLLLPSSLSRVPACAPARRPLREPYGGRYARLLPCRSGRNRVSFDAP
jgi:hypothetical protein